MGKEVILGLAAPLAAVGAPCAPVPQAGSLSTLAAPALPSASACRLVFVSLVMQGSEILSPCSGVRLGWACGWGLGGSFRRTPARLVAVNLGDRVQQFPDLPQVVGNLR